MVETAVVIVDAHQPDLTDTKISNIDKLIKWAEKNDHAIFYTIPEGESLNSDVTVAEPYSILRYDPETQDPYDDARLDEQITNRDLGDVQYYGPGTKPGDFAQKERDRGRSSYAGPPSHSNAPDWAGAPEK